MMRLVTLAKLTDNDTVTAVAPEMAYNSSSDDDQVGTEQDEAPCPAGAEQLAPSINGFEAGLLTTSLLYHQAKMPDFRTSACNKDCELVASLSICIFCASHSDKLRN